MPWLRSVVRLVELHLARHAERGVWWWVAEVKVDVISWDVVGGGSRLPLFFFFFVRIAVVRCNEPVVSRSGIIHYARALL